MAKKRRLSIGFPLGGLDRSRSYRQQKPYTTVDCLNVVPYAQIEGRERGGSRPGMLRSIRNTGVLEPWRLMIDSSISFPGTFTASIDDFKGGVISPVWSKPSWATDAILPLDRDLAYTDDTLSDAAMVRDALPIDVTPGGELGSYIVDMFLVPHNGSYRGKYTIYVRMDNSSPDPTDEGVVCELVMEDDEGTFSGTVTSYTGGVPTAEAMLSGSIGNSVPGTFTVKVTDDEVGCMFANRNLRTLAAVDSHSGLRIGFGMETTVAGGRNLCDYLRVQYYSTESAAPLRSMVLCSADGRIFFESRFGWLTESTVTDLTLRDDVPLAATQSGQKIYVADYGDLRALGDDGVISGSTLDSATYTDWSTLGIITDDDVVVISNGTGSVTDQTYEIDSVAAGAVTLTAPPGDGNCSFRIERGPKVWNPDTDFQTMDLMRATAGQVPTGCPLITNYLDRVVLAGAETAPYVWYMARVSDELDWDYSQTDSEAAVSGTSSIAGTPGEAITALIPSSEDYLLIATRLSLLRMRGDPAFGGDLVTLSRAIGVVGKDAWCATPTGEIVFLSAGGVYVLPPGGNASPIPLSDGRIPNELKDVNPIETTVSMEFDVERHGIYIFLTSVNADGRLHFWLDWKTKTYWPMSFDADVEPTAICTGSGIKSEDVGVIIGSRDGFIRQFSKWADNDDGVLFSSYVDIGPIPLASEGNVGTLMSLSPVAAEASGNIACTVHPGLSAEAAANAASVASGTFVAGVGPSVRLAGRGQVFRLKLTGTPGRKWSLESIDAEVRDSGRKRFK